jgi:AcrR family transcriptional regulator
MPKVGEAHREKRRRAILDAALTCFDRKGLHGTTMQDIVAASGASAGAIYTYFDSKDAIISAIAADRHARERELIDTSLARPDPRAALHTFVNTYLDWLLDPDEQRRRRVNVHLWGEALHSEPIAAIVAEGVGPVAEVAAAVRAAAADGSFPTHVDPEGFVRAVLALILGFVLQQAWDPTVDVEGFRQAALAMVDVVLDAPAPSPA